MDFREYRSCQWQHWSISFGITLISNVWKHVFRSFKSKMDLAVVSTCLLKHLFFVVKCSLILQITFWKLKRFCQFEYSMLKCFLPSPFALIIFTQLQWLKLHNWKLVLSSNVCSNLCSNHTVKRSFQFKT